MGDDPPFVTRPGPAALLPGMIPGGVVIHVYAVPSGRHLLTRLTRSAAETEQHATEDADAAERALRPGEVGFCLVAYDGDSGERMAWHG